MIQQGGQLYKIATVYHARNIEISGTKLSFYQIEGNPPSASRDNLSRLNWKHSGSPVVLQSCPKTSFAIPGALVNMRAIPKKYLR